MIEAFEVRTQDLPHNVKAEFIQEAQVMLHELDVNWLEVCLLPAPDPQHEGHMVRAVANRNPEWYREYFGCRRRDGLHEWYGNSANIRRRVTKALRRIATTTDKLMEPTSLRYRLHGTLRAIIIERFKTGYIGYDGQHVEPNEVGMHL